MIEEAKKYHNFKKSEIKLRDLLPLIRPTGYSNYDELGGGIILCPECEEWTWVEFNLSNGILDLLGDLTVESIDAHDDKIKLWIKTDEFNWFRPEKTETP